ncbi:MAG TPA: winged helix-turn-helix domain-containing protein [Candidatus Limnocylindrales bacterium]|nr:winged helix-turn-helix domain-containing protein [Candidatus Limnocylindrales bacterium]
MATTSLILGDGALLNMRIAPHALWDVVASASVLAANQFQPQFPYRTWARFAHAAATGGAGAAMVRWAAAWPVGTLPRFVLLPPAPGGLDLCDLRDYVKQLPPAEIRDRLRHEYVTEVPIAYRQFDTDPVGAISAFADMASEYAQAIIRPHWRAIQETVREDVLLRAQTLVSAGIDTLLAALHRRIKWSRPHLSVAGTAVDGTNPREIVLVPLVFVQDRVVLSMNDEATLAVGYQTRGVGNLAIRLGGMPLRQSDRLATLLGATRAAIVRSLAVPSTTTSLAAGLCVAPSTVSEHLGLLVGSRVALRRRTGNKVYYMLSEQGMTLLHALSDPDE